MNPTTLVALMVTGFVLGACADSPPPPEVAGVKRYAQIPGESYSLRIVTLENGDRIAIFGSSITYMPPIRSVE